MISYLKGKIINKGQGYIILLVQDIGYKVFINEAYYSKAKIGQTREYYTYQKVREDALDLYGFDSLEELEMFELLLTISGVGPKSALGVLAAAGIGDIKEAIARGDSGLLIKVSGIGKKTAERIVLELRGKIGFISGGGSNGESFEGAAASGEEIDALMALGYTMQQARDALKSVDAKIKDSGQRIKAALKNVGK